jgi:hypothetical protein
MNGGTELRITVNIDIDPWLDLLVDPNYQPPGNRTSRLERIGLLPNGTSGGRAAAMMLVRLPDGKLIPVETTWRLLQTAVRALAASPVAQMEEL